MNPDFSTIGTIVAAIITASASVGAGIKFLLMWVDKRDERMFQVFADKLDKHGNSFQDVKKDIQRTNQMIQAVHQSVANLQKWFVMETLTTKKGITESDPLYREIINDCDAVQKTLAKIIEDH